MGGQGSGKWSRWDSKTTTADHLMIDIRCLKKQGFLQPDTEGTLLWSRDGVQAGSVRFRMETNQMLLNYQHNPTFGDLESVEQVISFDRTPCNFGGYRTWLICPNLNCGRRVAVLYAGGKHFLCRHCSGLVYSSQQESKQDRLMRKARKIRKRLGASNDLTRSILFKPKNMHQKTFDRLRHEADQARNRSFGIMGQRFGIKV